MKTKEELNVLKKEVEALNKKLSELTEDELRLVVGGTGTEFFFDDKSGDKEFHLYDGTVEKEFEPNWL